MSLTGIALSGGNFNIIFWEYTYGSIDLVTSFFKFGAFITPKNSLYRFFPHELNYEQI
jgi:hypothetical protein